MYGDIIVNFITKNMKQMHYPAPR